MNMAARMEQTSRPGWIQVSNTTGELLKRSGKENWLQSRGGISVKGKGATETFWLDISGRNCKTGPSSSRELHTNVAHFGKLSSTGDLNAGRDNSKVERLVDWNVDLLMRLLKQIDAHRQRRELMTQRGQPKLATRKGSSRMLLDPNDLVESQTILDEVSEIIVLPQFDNRIAETPMDVSTVELRPEIEKELREYVYTIAMMYRDNSFHNFEHAR